MNNEDIWKAVLFRYELMLNASQQQVVQQQEMIAELTAARDKLQEQYDALSNADDAGQ